MANVMKVNPYTFKIMKKNEKVTTPPEVRNFIKKCPEVAADEELTPEEAKRLRLEDLKVLNEIINDPTISATTRVQAVQARHKIVKDLMGDGIGVNQRSLSDLQRLLADDSTDDTDVTSEVTETETTDAPEEEIVEYTEAKVSVEDIKQQILDDEE